MTLTVHPDRLDGSIASPRYFATGIMVRAKHPVTGEWGSYDLGQLDYESLMRWLRHNGGRNPLAENTLCRILGHGIAMTQHDNRTGKNGRKRQDWQLEQDRLGRSEPHG